MASLAVVPAPVSAPRASERSETVGAAPGQETSGSPVAVLTDPEPKLDDFNASDTPYEDWTKAYTQWAIRNGRPQQPAALVPAPVASLTLYQLEEQLVAFADTAEMVSPEEEQQFLAEFQAALTAAVEKRDRVAQFMTHVQAQAAMTAAEITRLQERKQFFERIEERVERYVIATIQSFGQDAKGKWRKLEGKTVTFSIAKCPDSVEITDEALVPAEFKSTTITLPLPLWQELLDSLDLEAAGKIEDAVKQAKYAVSKTAVKAAMPVPGAKLVDDKYRLVRK